MGKPLVWMGQTYKALRALPEGVQDEFGYALEVAQLGGVAASAKSMHGNPRDVMEIVSDEVVTRFGRCVQFTETLWQR